MSYLVRAAPVRAASRFSGLPPNPGADALTQPLPVPSLGPEASSSSFVVIIGILMLMMIIIIIVIAIVIVIVIIIILYHPTVGVAGTPTVGYSVWGSLLGGGGGTPTEKEREKGKK